VGVVLGGVVAGVVEGGAVVVGVLPGAGFDVVAPGALEKPGALSGSALHAI
jgi:hypothetical protein